MKSTLRTTVLAVAAGASALLAAAPAAAQYVYVQPGIVAQPAVVAQGHYDHDARWARRDRHAPLITDVTPSHGERLSERGRTRISARIVDQGRSGIEYRSISLRVDGRDVTHLARFDGDDLRYREDLQPGRHHAELVVSDRAGNTARHAWSFFVRDDDRRDRYGYYDGRGSRW